MTTPEPQPPAEPIALLGLTGSTDASVWAEYFVGYPKAVAFATDEGAMLAWFANAIEAGRDAGRREALEQAERVPTDARQAVTRAVAEAIDAFLPTSMLFDDATEIAEAITARVLDADPPLVVLAADLVSLSPGMRLTVKGLVEHLVEQQCRADLAPLLALHRPKQWSSDVVQMTVCSEDKKRWPCPTIRALPGWLRPKEPDDA